MDEVRELAEKYLGVQIPQKIFEVAQCKALQKLEWIISREGDAAGERLKPYYLAQLVAEAIKSDVLTYRCAMRYENKKRADSRNADNSHKQPHYSTTCMGLSSLISN